MGIEKIDHFVVLMLENRSFDHMLGFLRSADYPIDGLTGEEWNPLDPHAQPPQPVWVSRDANYYGDINNPSHSMVPGALAQIFGLSDNEIMQLTTYPASPAVNDGFVYNYAAQTDPPPPPTIGPNIMRCFSPDKLPALAGLAPEFGICDHWFSSVPGPTWPNRWYVHAASSDGYAGGSVRLSMMKPIYIALSGAGVSWKIYFHDLPQSLSLVQLWGSECKSNFQLMDQFFKDAQSGTLPAYTFIEPRYFDINLPGLRANDQHPPHDVRFGEQLIAAVYNALRSSPSWNETLFVILYDEHGGLYDHKPPGAAVNPDGKIGRDDLAGHYITFAFDRLGVRVPAVLVSSYIPKGAISSETYDHTSLLAAVERRFNLPPLGHRDAQANSFEAILSLDAPRSDTPAHITPPSVSSGAAALAGLSEFQLALLDLADSLPGSHPPWLQAKAVASRRSAQDAGEYAAAAALRFLGR